MVDGPSLDDMLKLGLPDYMTGNKSDSDDTPTGQGMESLSEEAKAADQENVEDNDEDHLENSQEFEPKDADHENSDSDIDQFSDLGDISSDTEEEDEGDDDAFEEDRRNI